VLLRAFEAQRFVLEATQVDECVRVIGVELQGESVGFFGAASIVALQFATQAVPRVGAHALSAILRAGFE
jgi:hypothetical protein